MKDEKEKADKVTSALFLWSFIGVSVSAGIWANSFAAAATVFFGILSAISAISLTTDEIINRK